MERGQSEPHVSSISYVLVLSVIEIKYWSPTRRCFYDLNITRAVRQFWLLSEHHLTTGEVVLLVEEIAGESPAISSTRSTLIESINKIILYRPEFCLLDHINLLLLGPVGSGKSSLFNTIESTFKGTIKSRARAGDGVIPITKQVIIRKNRYRKISNFREIRREFWKDLITIGLLFVYTVCAKAEDLYFPLGIVHGRMLYLCIFQFWRYSISPQSSREPLNIRICDAPGVSVNSISPTDLAYMLDGHLSDRFLKTNLQQFNSNNFDFH